MREKRPALLAVAISACFLALYLSAAAETPKPGGILTYVVPTELLSRDDHREAASALIHPVAPFYSSAHSLKTRIPQDVLARAIVVD